MVMTRAIFDDQETPFRRLSGRGHGFPLYHERELPPTHNLYPPSRMAHLGGHESRNGDQVSENDSNSRPRSRIPVAVRLQIYVNSSFSHTDAISSVEDVASARFGVVGIKADRVQIARVLDTSSAYS